MQWHKHKHLLVHYRAEMALGFWLKPKGSQTATPKNGNLIVHVFTAPDLTHELGH